MRATRLTALAYFNCGTVESRLRRPLSQARLSLGSQSAVLVHGQNELTNMLPILGQPSIQLRAFVRQKILVEIGVDQMPWRIHDDRSVVLSLSSIHCRNAPRTRLKATRTATLPMPKRSAIALGLSASS